MHRETDVGGACANVPHHVESTRCRCRCPHIIDMRSLIADAEILKREREKEKNKKRKISFSRFSLHIFSLFLFSQHKHDLLSLSLSPARSFSSSSLLSLSRLGTKLQNLFLYYSPTYHPSFLVTFKV